ncbi:MAG: HU family DNA-binding protein [Nocardioidaceae bacterium]
MNKSQLIDALAAHFDGNRRAARHALESVVSTVTREVARGEKVAITGFGAFEKVTRPSRMVRNPRTGERTRAKKTAVPKFRAGSELKSVVSGARKPPKVSTPASATRKSTATATAKPPAKKSTAKKSTAKSTAKKAPARKTTAKKAPAKKSTAKKAPAKKSTAKKAPAKKSTAKKSTARKSTARSTTRKR